METAAPDIAALQPLAYHLAVVDYLKRNEPEVWEWASSYKAREEHAAEVRAHLLRETYRLSVEGHPEVHASLQLAMQRLRIDVPATIYQSGASGMNASLLYLPGEVHVVLQGPVLERLSAEDLQALFGHELAHYVLWSRDGGIFHAADRILNDALADSGASASHYETARRYGLYTELFADRGAAIAVASPAPAVTTLVKVETGILTADAASYLDQAVEVDCQKSGATQAHSHPEVFIRARALDLWWRGDDSLEVWLRRKVEGPLALGQLDLPGQMRLQVLTRGFLALFLADEALRSDVVVNQVRTLFADWSPQESPADLAELGQDHVDDSVRSYLNALMLDLALADADTGDATLLAAARMATRLGSYEALVVNLKRDARLGKRELDRLGKQLAKAGDA